MARAGSYAHASSLVVCTVALAASAVVWLLNVLIQVPTHVGRLLLWLPQSHPSPSLPRPRRWLYTHRWRQAVLGRCRGVEREGLSQQHCPTVPQCSHCPAHVPQSLVPPEGAVNWPDNPPGACALPDVGCTCLPGRVCVCSASCSRRRPPPSPLWGRGCTHTCPSSFLTSASRAIMSSPSPHPTHACRHSLGVPVHATLRVHRAHLCSCV